MENKESQLWEQEVKWLSEGCMKEEVRGEKSDAQPQKMNTNRKVTK